MKSVKEIVDVLNTFNNYTLSNKSDDGRVNSLDSEDKLVEDIILNLSSMSSIKVDGKSNNRDEHDLTFKIFDIKGELLISEGSDIKIVEPSNFTNTISFIKLSRMINLSGTSYETVAKSYSDKKSKGELKLTSDYSILFFDKSNNKFKHVYLSEMSTSDAVANPSNCIQTKIPTAIVNRTEEEKFEFIHGLWKSYIYKRIVSPAELFKDVEF
jgi:hypothetical protein